MESRITDTPTADEMQVKTADKVLNDLKGVLQRAEQKAVEQAKAADRVVRDHPYQTIGVVFGLGLLLGFLAGRK